MGDTETPNNMLPKAKHTSSSILSYRVGLDPIATSYLAGWIKWQLKRQTETKGCPLQTKTTKHEKTK